MNERIHWIDIVKGIGIILVVVGHTIKVPAIQAWIYSFHMPLFFFLSGYLLESKTITDSRFFINKCKSLLLPFFVFRLVLFIYWYYVECYFRPLDIGPIWFLIVLFFAEIITAPILCKHRKITHILIYIFICSVSFIMLNKIHYENEQMNWIHNWIKRIFNANIWLACGFLIKKISIAIHYKNQVLLFIIIFCSILVNAIGYQFNGDVSLYSNKIGNIFLYIPIGLAGISTIFFISKYCIRRNKWIEWIGTYSIIILAIHEPIKRIILKSISFLFTDYHLLQKKCLTGIFISFTVLLLCIPSIKILSWTKRHTGKYGNYILSFIK